MGEWFQTIADVEATPEDADGLGASILSWLVDTGVVLAEATQCVLAGEGHPPGPHYARAVTESDPGLLTLRANGVEVITGRSVFYSMGVDQVCCPRCRHVTHLDGGDADAWRELSDAISIWYDGGTGDHPCANCHQLIGLNEWAWSPPWGFGHLGITFWNWPPLRPDFVAELSQRLGHRTVHPHGKM